MPLVPPIGPTQAINLPGIAKKFFDMCKEDVPKELHDYTFWTTNQAALAPHEEALRAWHKLSPKDQKLVCTEVGRDLKTYMKEQQSMQVEEQINFALECIDFYLQPETLPTSRGEKEAFDSSKISLMTNMHTSADVASPGKQTTTNTARHGRSGFAGKTGHNIHQPSAHTSRGNSKGPGK